jgi:hypothetical protein
MNNNQATKLCSGCGNPLLDQSLLIIADTLGTNTIHLKCLHLIQKRRQQQMLKLKNSLDSSLYMDADEEKEK